jgi:DNA-binding NtrC family response regulator
MQMSNLAYVCVADGPLADEGRTPTVLIVDDDNEVRRSLAGALTAAGFHVFEARDGYQALALYVERRPDVVVTDVYMPCKNGIELVRELRSLDSHARLIGTSGAGAAGNFVYLGMVRQCAIESFRKPFDDDALLAIIERVLREG